ncbi:alpha-xylosidase [Vallitalea longa]|uniref:Alpha-xylosidase n=1 Tax=Vallitalea longa TaxID=2936439 RepID=A0A9W5YA67_9FIRM|nr:alpha-xylosidase [Vallitalea longa]GKX28224.1 alpha-xylosidase [Vallitalea longa]
MIDNNYRYEQHVYPVSLESYTFEKGNLKLNTIDSEDNELIIDINFYINNIIAVRVSSDNEFHIEYDFVNEKYRQLDKKVTVSDKDKSIVVSQGKYTISFNKDPYRMTILEDKVVVLEDSVDDVNPVGDGFDRISPVGYTLSKDKDVLGSNIGLKLRQDEHIYGFGEKFTDFDKRGQKVLIRNFDTLGCRDETAYKNIPFYVSTYKYGMYVNSHLMSEFNVGSESTSTISAHVPNKDVEYFIILGESLKEITSKFMNLTGPATLPPKWSFGLWYSTGFKDSSQELVEKDAKHFRDTKVPCDVFHFDCYWLREDKWCDFVWDNEMYPNRKEMLQNLKKEGYKICLWINPYVTIKTDMYKAGKELGYFIKDKDGNPYTADLWHGLLSLCAMVDFTNPNAITWFQGKVASLLEEGVDVLKTDFGENIPYDSVFYNGRTGEEIRNLYALLYNKAVYETTKKVKGKSSALVWGRSGFTGMQKYPVCWSGDPRSSYEGMSSTLRSGLSIGVSGVPFWSNDIGGFYGKVEDEVFVRWAQFGLFCSHSRLHGTSTRQPWAYSDRANNIVSEFIKLRYRLMPYIHETAEECVKEGVPFIRPLVLEHEDDPTVYNIYDQYYFGNDIMVAPVFGGDNAVRKIYLPEGKWQDVLRGTQYEGNKWITICAELEYMPVFIRNNQAQIPDDYKLYL